ncbi:hypothetical protein DFP72DRAFT_857657 [Ephemerocybe angulata]|uniref:Uncharacterized protein n=1 Tax=Ephemerocybe angulata TaxID=980116 RepID=A0A8H6HDX0_9AGAR|nr:hypothetical protein DFP72DRAFT_857657 [Tulosesus angulatus]
MTGYEAGSPFAITTFKHGLGFALRNRVQQDPEQPSDYEIIATNRTYRFATVQGPPYAYKTYLSAETGCRRLGDAYCWTIPRDGPADPMRPNIPIQGQAFEVLDWNMVCDRKGTYLSIGEPFVWRFDSDVAEEQSAS